MAPPHLSLCRIHLAYSTGDLPKTAAVYSRGRARMYSATTKYSENSIINVEAYCHGGIEPCRDTYFQGRSRWH